MMAASHTPKLPARLASLTLATLVACTVDPATTTEGAGSTSDATTAEPPTTTTPTAGTDDPNSTGEPTGDPTGDPLPPAEVPQGCNPIAYAADCMLPYPSDWFTTPDPSLPGGLRVALSPEALPKTLEGVAINNLLAHPADGFSQHMPILALFPAGIDTRGLSFHPDGGDATLKPTSPTLLLNADTGELVPHWVELDAMTTDPNKQALIVRPFVRLANTTRYIVAFQGLTAASGERVTAPLGFAHIVQGDVAGHPLLEPLAARYEAEIFPALTKLGVARDDLQLAWDFTTASDERNTQDMWAIRDDIVATLGQAGPALEVDLVLPEYSDEIALRVEGRIEVPLYLEADEPMAWLHRDGDGKVVANGTHWVPFTFQIPKTAFPTEPGFEPLRIIQFGHGFFGEREEINWSAMRAFSSERKVAMIATEWAGMAADDQGAVVQTIFDDPANVFLFTDRLHQGFANQLALSYAIKTTLPEAEAMSAFKQLLYDPEQLYWYGISQGSIFGATFMALSPTIEKAVLDVGGGPYSLMMTRSGSFSDLFAIVKVALGDEPLTVQKFIAMSQHTWDRVDPITYAPRVLQDPPEDSPPRALLFSFGVGDHSVTNVASHLLLRALGVDLLAPAAKQVYGLGTVPAPTDGSAGVVVDFMYPNPAGIEAKLPDPPPDEENVHEGVRRNPKIRDMIDAFLRPGGQIENFCEGPCDPE